MGPEGDEAAWAQGETGTCGRGDATGTDGAHGHRTRTIICVFIYCSTIPGFACSFICISPLKRNVHRGNGMWRGATRVLCQRARCSFLYVTSALPSRYLHEERLAVMRYSGCISWMLNRCWRIDEFNMCSPARRETTLHLNNIASRVGTRIEICQNQENQTGLVLVSVLL